MRIARKGLAVFIAFVLIYIIIFIHKKADRPLSEVESSPGNLKYVNKTSLPSDAIRLPFDEGASSSGNTEVRLLIVTYMRSGSTFLGSMFDRHPAAIYMFEPLVSIDNLLPVLADIGPMFWDKNREQSLKQWRDTTMSGFLNCTFKDLHLRALNHYFLQMGSKTTQFLVCLTYHPGILGIVACLPRLQRDCREAKVVVVKTIRYSMLEAFNLMLADPKLKVIHLLRDPRSTLRSQERLGVFDPSNVTIFSREFCKGVQEDIFTGDEMSKMFPGRVIRVRYEDIAQHPLTYIKHLLAFAGLNMTSDLESYIQEVTGGERSDAWANSVREIVRKTNSSATAFDWRDRYDFYHTSRIDSQCASMYKLTGYLPLATENLLKDLRVPSILSVSDIARFLQLE